MCRSPIAQVLNGGRQSVAPLIAQVLRAQVHSCISCRQSVAQALSVQALIVQAHSSIGGGQSAVPLIV